MVTSSRLASIDFSKDFTKLSEVSQRNSTESGYNWNTTARDWIYLHNLMYSALSGDSDKLVTEYGKLSGTGTYEVSAAQTADINKTSDNTTPDKSTQTTHVVQTYKDKISGKAAVYMSVADCNIGTSDANVSNLFRSLTIKVMESR